MHRVLPRTKRSRNNDTFLLRLKFTFLILYIKLVLGFSLLEESNANKCFKFLKYLKYSKVFISALQAERQ